MLLALALSSLVMAKTEAVFINTAPTAFVCLNSTTEKCLSRTVVASGRSCTADAVLLDSGVIYKVPDQTEFACDETTCEATSWTSSLIMEAGIMSKGEEHYGEMTVSEFESLFPFAEYCDGTPRQ